MNEKIQSEQQLSKRDTELSAITEFQSRLEQLSWVPIERAAEITNRSVRTMYRARDKIEHKRQSGRIFFSARGLRRYLEEEYHSTPEFDVNDEQQRAFKQPRRRSQLPY